LAVTGNVDGDLPMVGQKGLARVPIPAVGGSGRLPLIRLEAQMVGHFGLEHLLDQAGGQLLEETLAAEEILRLGDGFQELLPRSP
jgi:hypothetical protein